ncbi:putative E3 ubiquitin-protein ligase ZNRF2 [Triangularia verruculosa]|uniref:E3 ubiquitin-protein ligase ZNRF2 n=1 Tax=Triangularia verruculosa TaxID=2587418 RepID=A0AAN7ANU9_9PEZI|nr:putative E3 ubiquitin-protein ligase ZNRF2 [Triangularia verruculosa]
MATRGYGSAHAPIELSSDSDSDRSSSVNGSDYIETQEQERPARTAVCQWRTPRFHSQECSRYWDCPSHIVERAPSEELQEEQGNEPGGQSEDLDMDNGEERPDPGAVSPLSEDGADRGNDGHTRPRSPSPEPPASEAPPVSRSSGSEAANALQALDEQRTIPGTSAENPLILVSSPVVAARGQLEPEQSTSSAGPSTATSNQARGSYFSQQQDLSSVVSAAATTRQQPPLPTRGDPQGELILPRWQPDAEVTYCPICQNQFSIFVRKHHCRKCGRVVCASCSPHRITIPYQYIVQPPGAPRVFPQRTPLPPSDRDGWYPNISGGERVRLCNPCVPDPNTAPPQAVGANNDNTGTAESTSPGSNRWGFNFGGAQPSVASTAHARSRSVTMVGSMANALITCLPLSSPVAEHEQQPQQPGTPSTSRPQNLAYSQNTEGRILSGTPPVYFTAGGSSSRRHRPFPVPQRYQSILDMEASSSSVVAGPSGRHHHHSSRQLPATPHIAEEDECPVCHRELPPRTLSNYEAVREAHINQCIASHSAYGGGTPSSATPGESPLPPPPPRRTGMFPYTATEKDCVDSAECSICLEEFEVGAAMARLECLCRFHRACIGAWWERHPGRCPMHSHDGFGF